MREGLPDTWPHTELLMDTRFLVAFLAFSNGLSIFFSTPNVSSNFITELFPRYIRRRFSSDWSGKVELIFALAD